MPKIDSPTRKSTPNNTHNNNINNNNNNNNNTNNGMSSIMETPMLKENISSINETPLPGFVERKIKKRTKKPREPLSTSVNE